MAIPMRVGVQERERIALLTPLGRKEGENDPTDQIKEKERGGADQTGEQERGEWPYLPDWGGGHKKGNEGPTDQMEWQNGFTYKNS